MTILFLAPAVSRAEMYKWVDEDGRTHYGDEPPAEQATREIKGNISSYKSAEVVSLPDDFFDHLRSRQGGNRKHVVMYSASWCGICKRAKRYFVQNDIPHSEYDIDTSAKGKRDYQKLNGTGVPIILVGKKRMNGFSKSRFEKLYYKK